MSWAVGGTAWCSVFPPDAIEGMPVSSWPFEPLRSALSSGDAGSSAQHVGTPAAVPSVPAPAGSASILGGGMAGLQVPIANKKKLMVNIYMVGIARLTEFARDEHTCSVIDGCVRLARATLALHITRRLIV